jgi:hypothetical protein
MTDLYKEVKNKIEIWDVALWLGIDVNQGYSSCPFHREDTPSMKLYPNRYFCFGCGASGDSIDLTSKLLGVSSWVAVNRLNEAFKLGLERGNLSRRHNNSPEEARALKLAKLMNGWKVLVYDELADFCRACCEPIIYADASWRKLALDKLSHAEELSEEFLELSAEELYSKYQKERFLNYVFSANRRRRQLEKCCTANRETELKDLLAGIMAGPNSA